MSNTQTQQLLSQIISALKQYYVEIGIFVGFGSPHSF